MAKIVRGKVPYLLLEDGEEVYLIVGVRSDVVKAVDGLVEIVPPEKRDIALTRLKGVFFDVQCVKRVLEKGECGYYDEMYGIGVVVGKCKDAVKRCGAVLYYLGEAPIRKVVI